jgi:UDP-N-acetylglucosamine acyltransferase
VIHEAAFIHPNAKLGNGVKIGPGVIVDEHVEIGDKTEVRAHAVITGHTKIGARNQIGYGAIIGAEPQDLSFKQGTISYVEIGDDNLIREYATIHRGTKPDTATRVGNHNFLMAGVHLAHNCEIGDHVVLVNNVLLAGYVQVHDRAFLGGGVVVHQFTRIGQLAMIRGQTRLGMDVPPFVMAVSTNAVCGLNRVGLRRNGYNNERRREAQSIYNTLYYSGLNRRQAIEAIAKFNSLDAKIMCDFLSSTKRGLCRAVKAREVASEEGNAVLEE